MNYKRNKLATWSVCVCLTVFATVSRGQETTPALPSVPDEEQTVDLGYYSLPAQAVTGAVSSVSGEELRKTPDASLPRTFAGRFTGLTTLETNTELSRGGFDTESIGMSWWIRGLSTVNGSTPAIILDGVLCPNTSYAYLSPDEIESVTILRDASGLSLYGIQGANGIISIRTRRGPVGRTRVKVTVDQSLQQMTRRPLFVNSGDYAEMRNQAGYNDGLGRYSQFSQEDVALYRAGGNELYPNNNWYDMFVRPLTSMTRAGITVYGGSEKVQYFSNVNYMHQQSPYKTTEEPGSKYDPQPSNNWFNFRSNIDMKFNSYLSGFLRLAGNVKNERTTGYSNAAIYDHLFSLPPTMYGPLTPSGEGYENGGQVVTHDDENLPVYGMLNRSGYMNNLYVNITAQAGLNLDLGFLTKGLTLGGTLAFQSNSLNQTSTTQNFERYVRTKDMSGLYFTHKGSELNTPLSYGKYSTMDYNLNLFAHVDYNRTFGDHSINAMGYIFYLKQELQKSNLPYKRESLGATVTYGFKNRYFIKGDIGYSGSDQFHPDHRYVPTPSISAAWVVSNESFLHEVNWLNLLKFRASYGITANDQLGGARILYTDYIDVNGNEGLKGNPSLSAEKMKKQNYGFDLGLFHQLSLSFDWYRSVCDNMLVSSSGTIPEYQGVTMANYPKTNWGRMENQGFEIEALYEKQIRDWSFYVGGSFSYNRNKVIDVNEAPYSSDYAYRHRTEGYSSGQLWGYLIDYSNGNGMFNFQDELDASGLTYSFGTPRVGDFIYRDLNGDKVIDEKDMAPIGYSRLPRETYTITAGFKWKGLEVSILFQGVEQCSAVMSGVGVYENAYQGVFNDIHRHAWTPERWNNGERIGYPALSLNESTNHVSNNFFVWDTSFLRLKNAEIAYTLPQRLSRKIGAEHIRFSLSGQNLLTFDNMRSKYIDPEVGTLGDFQPYRIYNLGVSVTF